MSDRGKGQKGIERDRENEKKERKGVHVAYASMYAQTCMYAYNCAGMYVLEVKK